MDATLLGLFSRMDALGASDLFLSEGKRPAVRVHGTVSVLEEEPVSRSALRSVVETVLPERLLARFDATGDLDAGLTLDNGQRVRINFSLQQGRLGLVARAVPSGALSLDALGLPGVVGNLVDVRRGLVLVTGATGSGKSTTLAALVHRLNAASPGHIVTIEDPIEFVHHDELSRVSQREVGTDTESYAAGLRHVVRQSPDVIVIGELRDAETVQLAVSAALTGHLVLASMHTVDCVQTLRRLLRFFADGQREQAALDLSMCLMGVVCQRLVPRKSGGGRVLASEVLRVTPSVRRLLREQRSEEVLEHMRADRSADSQTFTESLFALYARDELDFDVGRIYATNPDAFALKVRGMSTGTDSIASSEELEDDVSTLDMNQLIEMAMQRGASDLHLTVGRPPILRVAGTLHAIGTEDLADVDLRTLLFSIMTGRQRSQYELEREIDFALAVSAGRRFRVNAYYQKGRMAAALRAIPSKVPEASTLGLPPVLLRLGSRSQGLLLVVGPTGAGKSTTLACLVDRINQTRSCRILTIEDPIEYVHESAKATVDQREVHADTHSFAAALKYVLRQDPDVILVGEMRNVESIAAALTAAETGHLVLATLHSNDAMQAIDRIVDVFPSHQQSQARTQLAACLVGICSQRLLPRKEGEGRVPAFEVMVATPAMRNLIRENKLHQARSIMESSRRDGMVTLDNALKKLYEDGLVAFEDVQQYLNNPRAITEPRGGLQAPAPGPAASSPAPVPPSERPAKSRFPWKRD